MKKAIYVFAFAFLGTLAVFGQKKENGTIYIEHPAIKIVDEFSKAMVAGDSAKIAGFLTEDFKAYNGTSNTYGDKGMKKMNFVKNALRYSKELDYFSVETLPGSYPDAVEYKKDNKEGEVVVQTWDLLKGLHKVTGVKLDAAAHRLFTLTKDNKIKTIIIIPMAQCWMKLAPAFLTGPMEKSTTITRISIPFVKPCIFLKKMILINR